MIQDSNSAHSYTVRCFKKNLKNNIDHFEKVMENQNEKMVLDVRLRLKTCAFRGHNESTK
jgi:hypothetical protein